MLTDSFSAEVCEWSRNGRSSLGVPMTAFLLVT